ncbi:hypothetical protein GCM10015534_55650 [Streptomyces diastaticus subsp. diastaticus]|nr:hypothetical protein GCM10015534_55650 [Streptomyces diastaticus subsp. diastaticus]
MSRIARANSAGSWAGGAVGTGHCGGRASGVFIGDGSFGAVRYPRRPGARTVLPVSVATVLLAFVEDGVV